MTAISVYIIAYNEADKIAAAIDSVQWADEVVVIDSHSQDDTVKIAESLGARVVQVEFAGFGALRNSAIATCRHDWIFSLDSDERCTPSVEQEVRALTHNPSYQAYFVPRRNFFLGKEIRHSGWYPNYRQPQLFHRDAMRYEESPVHEGFVLAEGARTGYLKNAIWQLPFKDVSESIAKMNRYSSLGATKPRQHNASYGKALGHGVWAFVRHYVFKRGFLDGWVGFIIAFSYFEVTFYRYVKSVENQYQKDWQAYWDTVSRTSR